MKPTPGSVAGTKIVLLRGGPPEWDGEVAGVSKTGGGKLERWDHTADLPLVFVATEETEPVQIERHRKGGTVIEEKKAQVYECVGYRDVS